MAQVGPCTLLSYPSVPTRSTGVVAASLRTPAFFIVCPRAGGRVPVWKADASVIESDQNHKIKTEFGRMSSQKECPHCQSARHRRVKGEEGCSPTAWWRGFSTCFYTGARTTPDAIPPKTPQSPAFPLPHIERLGFTFLTTVRETSQNPRTHPSGHTQIYNLATTVSGLAWHSARSWRPACPANNPQLGESEEWQYAYNLPSRLSGGSWQPHRIVTETALMDTWSWSTRCVPHAWGP